MIPLKINTWGDFIDKKGKKGRVAIENLPNKLDFRIYQDADDKQPDEMVVDEWLPMVGHAEYSLMEYFTSVTWEESENDVVKMAKIPYFLPDKMGKITSAMCYENENIEILTIFINEKESIIYNIPADSPAWLINIENNQREQIYTDVIVQIETLAYFFELYKLKILYPNYFDLNTLDGLLEAIAYWNTYISFYVLANDELAILISFLAEKLIETPIPNNIKDTTKILAAWKIVNEHNEKTK